jgi:hypothetical protein
MIALVAMVVLAGFANAAGSGGTGGRLFNSAPAVDARRRRHHRDLRATIGAMIDPIPQSEGRPDVLSFMRGPRMPVGS